MLWKLLFLWAIPVTQSASTRRLGTIHVAHILNEQDAGRLVVQYIDPVLNSEERTLLPDYDIVVDNFVYSLGSGNANVKLAEAFRPDNRTYAAILGPRDLQAVEEGLGVTHEYQILQMNFADAPAGPDKRVRYPYNFRSVRSSETGLIGWYYILAMNGWTKLRSQYDNSDLFDAGIRAATRYGLEDFSFLLPAPALEAGAEWLLEAASLIRSESMRNLAFYGSAEHATETLATLACHLNSQQLGGFQWFLGGMMPAGWWHAAAPAVSCTPADVMGVVKGYISLRHTTAAGGSDLLGAKVPEVFGAEESLPLACTPSVTASEFFTAEEHLELASAAGHALVDYLPAASVVYDGLCAILLGLHDVLYNKHIALDELKAREDDALRAVVASVQSVDFQGTSGRFAFMSGTQDPIVLFLSVEQWLLQEPESFVVTGVMLFPDGMEGEPSMTQDMGDKLTWRDGSRGFPFQQQSINLNLFENCSLIFGELIADRCEPCPPGRYFDPLLARCRLCAHGEYQEEPGQLDCVLVSPGFYIVNVSNPEHAAPCPAGQYCPEAGVQPRPCATGRYSDVTGMRQCAWCPVGTYQAERGATACLQCNEYLPGSTTSSIQSTLAQDCMCNAGSFLPLDSTECKPCPEGMTCVMGSDMRNLLAVGNGSGIAVAPYPTVDVGFMTRSGDPLVVYKCREEGHCPGGPPGTCAAHRDVDAIACGKCKSGSYGSDGRCLPCGGEGWLPMATAALVTLAGLGFALLAMTTDGHKVQSSAVLVAAMAGLLSSSLQTMAVFKQLAIEWVEPMRSLLNFVQLIIFDLEVVRAGCVLGADPLTRFTFRQAIAPMLLPFAFLCVLAKKYAPRIGSPSADIPLEFINAVGSGCNALFISILISTLGPFICYSHPGDAKESVLSAASVLCFEGQEFGGLLIISLIAFICVPLPFFVLCILGVWRYPRALQDQDDRLVIASRFLLFRFTPSRYYFPLVMLVKSILICLVPVFLKGLAGPQILMMCAILVIYSLIEQTLRPWRGDICNFTDSCLHILLITILVCGAMFVERKDDTSTVAMVGALLFLLLVLAVLGGLAVSLRKWLLPHRYDYFLCHHKAHAAAQSRYLKMLIQEKKNVSVFIDSDDLQELDKLFDIVKCRVRNLVVYLTAETLRRPWCAGEIVTATRMRLKFMPVYTKSFQRPTEEQLDNIDTYIDSSDCNLSEYGIEGADVAHAYTALFELMPIEVDYMEIGTKRFDSLAICLLAKSTSTRASSLKTPHHDRAAEGGLLISALPDSDEAIACGAIVVSRIQAKCSDCETSLYFLPDYHMDASMAWMAVQKAAAVIVLLSHGTLQCPVQLAVMCEAIVQHQHSSLGLVSIATPGFEYPSQHFYDEVLPATVLKLELQAVSQERVRSFFRIISIFLPTHGSQQAIEAQIDVAFNRVRGHLQLSTSVVHVSTNRSPAPSIEKYSGSLRPSHSSHASQGSVVSPIISCYTSEADATQDTQGGSSATTSGPVTYLAV